MKKILAFLFVVGGLLSGGVYFVAETIILPQQEKVWRALLEDLPYGLEADFGEVDFEYVGLRLSIRGATVTDDDETTTISEIVAENSLTTALGNLIRFAMGREEEHYDKVRFIGVKPASNEQKRDVDIREVRLLDVAIGVDNKLPTTMKTLTGAINLEEAFTAGTIGGFEVYGLSVVEKGLSATLDWLKVHDISSTNIGKVDVFGLAVKQAGMPFAQLDALTTTNFNIASLMEPGQIAQLTKDVEPGDLSPFNIFHVADDFALAGLNVQVPGMGGVAIKRLIYNELDAEDVATAGLVPTRTYSDLQEFDISFPGLALLSPQGDAFMKATKIDALRINGRSESYWDLSTGMQNSEGWLELVDLIKFTAALQIGNAHPEDFVKAAAWGQALTGAESPVTSQSASEIMAIYGAVTLKRFDLLIENKSLIERLYQYGATLGMAEADLKTMMDMQLAAMGSAPDTSAEMTAALDALRRFVANPVNVRVVLAPKAPVAVNDMLADNPDQTLINLGLTVTANQEIPES